MENESKTFYFEYDKLQYLYEIRRSRGDKNTRLQKMLGYWYERKKDKLNDRTHKINKWRIMKGMDKYFSLFFDIETFEYYESENSEEPKIIPYLIGVLDSNNNYKVFKGSKSVIDFLKYIFTKENWGGQTNNLSICAFNIDYDFNVVRPWIDECFPEIGYDYTADDSKKFLFGEIYWKDKPGRGIKIVDLWRWNPTQSLKSYMSYIRDLVYDKQGNVKNEKPSRVLHDLITKLGYTSETFKKLDFDAVKVNLHESNGNYYYWRSREDWIAKKTPVKLDLEHELKYLENDVKSLAVIQLEQKIFKKLARHILGIRNVIDLDFSITIPGYGKYLLQEYLQKYMTENFRVPVSLAEYNRQNDSYLGAFVAGNKHITYLDEKVFKKLFPNKSFYDSDNKPIIRSYDVNSMYPWAMITGLPVYTPTSVKPKSKNYVTWYEIHFKDYIDPSTKTLYRWKPKYDWANNTFFGESFEFSIIPGVHTSNKVYILKELWELFDSMCDHNAEIVTARYQEKSYEHLEFVNTLYEIKADRQGKQVATTKSIVKLILNSLYGKMAERYKELKIMSMSNVSDFIMANPYYKDKFKEWFKELDILDYKSISKFIKTYKFKHKIAPHIDEKTNSGFVFIRNVQKRYNVDGEELRESIYAGMYITAMSRWKLLKSVKDEIDNGNIVLYCDTDSIKMLELNTPKFECDNINLGAWKLEGMFTHFGHPNKLKKYFLHNSLIEYTPKNEKLCWQVKSSGVPIKSIRNKNGLFDLETIKILNDENNRVLIKKCKNSNYRNDWYQTVIRYVDFKYTWNDLSIKEPTHIIENNELIHV